MADPVGKNDSQCVWACILGLRGPNNKYSLTMKERSARCHGVPPLWWVKYWAGVLRVPAVLVKIVTEILFWQCAFGYPSKPPPRQKIKKKLTWRTAQRRRSVMLYWKFLMITLSFFLSFKGYAYFFGITYIIKSSAYAQSPNQPTPPTLWNGILEETNWFLAHNSN